MSHREFRVDIQALRGLAVLLVVLYHAGVPWLGAGYLGVDIFFVISGYLITTLIAVRLQRGDFSLRDFYARRAKRLLPAAYIVFALTAAATALLNEQEAADLVWQVIGAVTFTGNMALWQQTGYFHGAGDLKPLLHTWSLSIEEQYYLLLPATLMLVPARRWLSAVALAGGVSLAACLVALNAYPSATFYLLPTRAWELLIGSAGALLMLDPGRRSRMAFDRWHDGFFYASLLALVLVPSVATGTAHPGVAAVVVCLATLIVILRQHPGGHASSVVRALAWLGDISYSLYLVHWPVLALMRNTYIGNTADMPALARGAGVLASVVLAYALYRWIEDPIRQAPLSFSRLLVLRTIAASVVVMAIAPVAQRILGTNGEFARRLAPNYGLSSGCEFGDTFTLRPECMTRPDARILVWGDSFAMHLVPGLVDAAGPRGIVQATQSECGPWLGVDSAAASASRTAICRRFNDSVMAFIESSNAIETVVVGSTFLSVVDDSSRSALLATITRVQAAGKRVVVFSPTPSTGHDVARCLERVNRGLWSWGDSGSCSIPFADYTRLRSGVIALMDTLESTGVPLVRLDKFLCDDRSCRTMIADTLVYRDRGHLSYEGSRLLAREMDWSRAIQ
jgi:peptidoglycan/LPS O-acetylase OafA/YrhL